MADMLSTGVSGLLAFQRTLDTISHNIANANTEGYSRQTVDLAARRADFFGGYYLGNGVDVAGVRRLFDQALVSQQRGASSALQQLDIYANFAERLDKLFGDPNSGVSASLQQFNNALETMATTPTSIAARQVVLSQAQNLVNRLKSYQGSIDSMGSQIAAQLGTEAQAINSLSGGIADLNRQILAAQVTGQSGANDLMDRRDQLIAQLNEKVGVSVVADSSGALNISLGNGQSLVVGATVSRLSVGAGEFDRAEPRLMLNNGAYSVDISSQISGGRLGGLMQLRNELLRPAGNALGQVAAGLATIGNAQHRAGLDLSGAVGGDLFAVGDAAGLAGTANTGSASLQITRTSVAALTTNDYVMRFDGTSWSVSRQDSGVSVPISGAGSVASPLVFDGLSIVISGAAQANDSFLVKPTGQAISGLRVLITAPEKLAAAAPLLTTAAAANAGNATISSGALIAGGSWTRGNYSLQFTAPGAWQVRDASNAIVAAGAYTPGTNIDFNGMRVVVSGAPAAGDSFAINDNINAKGDGRNARALIDMFDSNALNGGTTSLTDAVGNLVSSIGVKAGQAAVGRDAQAVVLDDATNAVQGVSGVNLDEEAAALVRFQQAYQAAARVIAAANAMFDELISAVRS